MLNLNRKKLSKKFRPDIPVILSIIGISSKGCANTYKTLHQSEKDIISDIQSKWSRELNEEMPVNITEHSFKMLTKIPVNAYVKYFQFKLIHSRIVTNKRLVEMEIKLDPKCYYCNYPQEEVVHALWSAQMYPSFGKRLKIG